MSEKQLIKDTLEKAHQIMFEMLCEVDSILLRHNIRYIIGSGTLLGAVRHKNFIPWDDDIDIIVYEEDYNAAINLLISELSSDYVVHNEDNDPMYYASYSKVKHCKSKVFYADEKVSRRHQKLKYQGLQISIFKAPKYKYFNRYYYIAGRKIFSGYRFYKHQQGILNRFKFIVCAFLIPMTKVWFLMFNALPGKKYRVLVNMDSLSSWHKGSYKDDDIAPFIQLEFRGRMFNSPKNYHEVLTDYYGKDYMQLPPPEKRRVHFSNIEFL